MRPVALWDEGGQGTTDLYSDDQPRADDGKWTDGGGGGGGGGSSGPSYVPKASDTDSGKSAPAAQPSEQPTGGQGGKGSGPHPPDKDETTDMDWKPRKSQRTNAEWHKLRTGMEYEDVDEGGHKVRVYSNPNSSTVNHGKSVEAVRGLLRSGHGADVTNVEVYGGGMGYSFKVGTQEFESGGHWDKTDGTIRIFSGTASDRDLYHEGNHAEWDGILHDEEDEAGAVVSDRSERMKKATDAYSANREERLKRSKELDEKYRTQHEQFDKKLKDVRERMYNYEGSRSDNNPEFKALKREEYNVKRYWARVSKKENAERTSINKSYSEDQAWSDIMHPRGPVGDARDEFMAAQEKEMALTAYAMQYQLAKHPTWGTEAYAAFGEVYDRADDAGKERLDKSHPLSVAAYKKLRGAHAEHKKKTKGGKA